MNLFRKNDETKPLQKTIMLYNRDLINALTEEEAIYENTTPSVIIENCVLSTLLPQNHLLSNQLNLIYTQKISIKSALINILSTFGIELDGRYYSPNNLILFKYVWPISTGTKPCFENNPLFVGTYDPSYLTYQLELMCSHLEKENEKNPYLNLPINIIKYHINDIENFHYNSFLFIFELILDNWKFLYNLPATYRTLMEVCKLTDDQEFERANLHELRKILISIEKSWKTTT